MIYALFVIAVGVAMLAGWRFHVPLLKSSVPGVVTMKANAALAFVLAGGLLLLLSPSPASLARAAGERRSEAPSLELRRNCCALADLNRRSVKCARADFTPR